VRPMLLDLFCGAGGCSVGYQRAGFDVVGVDIEPQPNYPFEFHQHDALPFLRGVAAMRTIAFEGRVDAIHASPPCQAHSTLKARWKDHDHPDLVAATRELLMAAGLPYVIENVEGAPLHEPVTICGSSLGLNVRRHRLFETNWGLMVPPCAHGWQTKRFDVYEHGKWRKAATVPVYGHGGGKANAHGPEAMGIDWMTRAELVQAIPPAYTELIGHQLMQHLNAERSAA
jgi:DNA (cytosine-5)-methyltransferase 1